MKLLAILLASLLVSPALAGHRGLPIPTLSSDAKAPLRGLVTMGRLSWNAAGTQPPNDLAEALAHPGVYTGATCDIRWKDIQTAQGGAIDTTVIEACLSTIATYNLANPTKPLKAKLAIFPGKSAPDWAKSLDGGPITLVENGGFTTGLWWGSAYRAAWKSMLDAVAVIYDTDSRVQEVHISSCSAFSGEPMIEPLGVADLAVVIGAGYTDALEMACLRGAISDYSAWTHVSLDYPVSIFRETVTGAIVNNSPNSISIQYLNRVSFGDRATSASYALQNPVPSQNTDFYNVFLSIGGPIMFQYVSQAAETSDMAAGACPQALAFNATQLELWDSVAAGGTANVTQQQLQDCSTLLGGY